MDTLPELIERAKLASERMGAENPNRLLLKELAVAIVALARANTDLLKQVEDKPRIVLP